MAKPTDISKRHGFSRPLAREYGVKEAIVLRFLSHHIRKSKNLREGKQWYYNSVAELATRFPYIPRSTLGDIITRLEKKHAIEVGNFNCWKQDKTRWFTMDRKVMDVAEKDVIWFETEDAVRWDICEAVLLNNLRSNLEKKLKKGEEDPFQQMSPSILKEILPFSAKTIERALTTLKTDKVIIQKETRSSLYQLAEIQKVVTSKSDKVTPKPDMPTSEPDVETSNPAETTSESVDVTHCKQFESPFQIPLKIPFINSQAAPAEVREQFEEPKIVEELDQSKSMSGEAKNTRADTFIASEVTVDLLKLNNELRTEFFKDGKNSAIIDSLAQLTYQFTSSLSPEQILNIQQLGTRENILRTIQPLFASFYAGKVKSGTDQAKQDLFEVALELILESFVALNTKIWQHSIQQFQQYAYEIMLPMVKTLEENRSEARRKQYEECKRDFASVDQHKEAVANLAPAEKTRVLRNALQSMNMVGWPPDAGPWPVDQIIYNTKSLDIAERFFELNPNVSVAELLPIIDKCVVALLTDVPENTDHDPLWHAKKGVNLAFFFKYLQKITESLQVSNTFVLLPEDENTGEKK